METILELRELDKRFGGLHVTRRMSLKIAERELSAVIGPNGAGKTTLFNLITGHIHADSGSILYGGADITGKKPESLVGMGVVKTFQVASLFPDKTVYNNVYLAGIARFRKNRQLFTGHRPVPEVHEHTEFILSTVGLTFKRDSFAYELSHGAQKVLDIAISLALQPRLLLLDEPTAGMSSDERMKMRQLIKKLHEQFPVTILFIEHDMDMVLGIADIVRVLVQGQLIAEESPEAVMRNKAVIDAYLGY